MSATQGLSRRQPSGSTGVELRAEAVRELTDWLIREGRFLPDNTELFTEFCDRVAAAAMPLDRATLHLRALHPQYRGVARIWRRGRPLEVRFMDHGIEKTATYIESPVRAVAEAGERLDWRLDGNTPLPFPLLDELREEGYTQYVIAPFVYAEGLVNAISWATARPGGFAEDEAHFLSDMLPALSVIVEQKAMRRFVGHMLTTYIGAEAGRLILDGQVRRGDVRTMTAALMLVDLRDFSLLSDRMRPRAVIRMLNEYFDCVIPPVHEQGGEVVEIMGDGVLAFFHQVPGRSAKEACRDALAAARQGLAALAEHGVLRQYRLRRPARFHRDRPRCEPDQPDRAFLPRTRPPADHVAGIRRASRPAGLGARALPIARLCQAAPPLRAAGGRGLSRKLIDRDCVASLAMTANKRPSLRGAQRRSNLDPLEKNYRRARKNRRKSSPAARSAMPP